MNALYSPRKTNGVGVFSGAHSCYERCGADRLKAVEG